MNKKRPLTRTLKKDGTSYSLHTMAAYGLPFSKEQAEQYAVIRRLKGVRAKQRTAATVQGRSYVMFCNARQRAKKDGVEFSLTLKWIEDKVRAGFCELSGLPFDLTPSTQSRSNPYCSSIDRIDPAGPYSAHNVRIILWLINVAKQDWTDAELLAVAYAYVQMQMSAAGV